MNVSMTVGDIIVSAVISLIAGVITGIITGYGVTIYYRNKDKKARCGEVYKRIIRFYSWTCKNYDIRGKQCA